MVMQWIIVIALWVWKPFYCWAVRKSITKLCMYLCRFTMQMAVITLREPVSFI
jgi:hypothetical protein